MSSILNVQFWEYVGAVGGIYAIFAYGLQIEFGFAGLLNFGHVAFMALGAYSVAILVVRTGMPLLAAAACGVAIAALGGALMAIPTVRLRADYFAISTIAVSQAIDYFLTNWTSLTGGAVGSTNLLGPENVANYNGGWLSFVNHAESALRHVVGSAATPDLVTLLLSWVIAALVAALLLWLTRSPWGRVVRAIREDEDAAAAVGHRVFVYKVQVLAVGSAIAGVSGVLYALFFENIDPTQFDPLVTFYAWTVLILGGASKLRGVPVGAVVYGFILAAVLFFNFPPFSSLGAADRSYLQLMLVGLVLIALMRFRPQGLFGSRQEMLLE